MLTKLLWLSAAAVLAALIYWVNFTDPLPGEPDYAWKPQPEEPEPARTATPARFEPERAFPRLRLPDDTPDPEGPIDALEGNVEEDEVVTEAFAGTPNIPEPTAEEIDALTLWYEERGRLSPFSEYRTYSLSVLEALAEQGDIYALQLVARHAMRANERERAQTYLTEAAARGSTHALERLARDQYVMMLRARRADNLSDARLHAIEALAWFETAYQRGDLNARTRINALRSDLDSIELPEESWAEAEARAESRFEQLSQQRAELGYPAFDNEPHPVLRKYYDLYRARDN